MSYRERPTKSVRLTHRFDRVSGGKNQVGYEFIVVVVFVASAGLTSISASFFGLCL